MASWTAAVVAGTDVASLNGARTIRPPSMICRGDDSYPSGGRGGGGRRAVRTQ